MMYRCTKCRIEKAAECFYKDAQKPGGRDLHCRDCRAEKARRWRDADRANYHEIARASYQRRAPKIREAAKKAYQMNPMRWRDYNLRNNYGITLEEYNVMLHAQKGLCAICGKPPTRKSLHLDHNHATKKIRALLCHRCNLAIGAMDENPDLLRRAIEYLNHHNGE